MKMITSIDFQFYQSIWLPPWMPPNKNKHTERKGIKNYLLIIQLVTWRPRADSNRRPAP